MGETPSLTFGEELRRERLIREVSLEEISTATKISVRLLTALEKSDLSRLPAPVFTRGFIRSYSRHLGLDPDEMVNAYLADLAPDKGRDGGSKKGGLRSRFLRGRRAAASTIVISVTAILLLLGLIARPERRGSAATPIVARPLRAGVVQERLRLARSGARDPGEPGASSPPKAAGRFDGARVRAGFLDRSVGRRPDDLLGAVAARHEAAVRGARWIPAHARQRRRRPRHRRRPSARAARRRRPGRPQPARAGTPRRRASPRASAPWPNPRPSRPPNPGT